MSAAQPESDDSLARAWCLYNWANHAWATPVAAALIGPWMLSLVKQAVGSCGVVIGVGPLVLRGDAFPSAMVAVASVAQLIVLPAVGAHVDARSTKRRWLTKACVGGSVVCAALGLTTSWTWFVAGALFVLGSLAEGVSDLAWQGMLPEIAGPSERDGLSARGSAIGYFGGGVILAINLAIVEMHDSVGLTKEGAVRLCFVACGAWWLSFGLLSLRRLQPHQRRRAAAPAQTWRRLRHDLRLLSGMPNTARYVLAYLFFGDAVSAVISLSAIFLTHESVRRQHHEGDAVPAGTDPGYSVRGPRRCTARRSTGSPVGSTASPGCHPDRVAGSDRVRLGRRTRQGRSGRGRDCHRRVARDHRAAGALAVLSRPVVAQQQRAIIQISSTGRNLANGTAKKAGALDFHTISYHDGQIDLRALQAREALVNSLVAQIVATQSVVRHDSSAWLIPPLANPRDQLGTELAKARRYADLAAIA